MTPRDRVEQEILEAFDNDYEPSPDEVAAALVDADVSQGEYEGCSTDLEIAFTEYEALARRALTTEGVGIV
jgi:hypothetical protein